MAKKNKQDVKQSEATNVQAESSDNEELTLNLTEKYKSYLSKMDKNDQKQIEKALERFKEDPRAIKMKSLKLVSDSSTISMEINGKTVPLRIIAYLEKKENKKALTLFWAGTHPDYDKVVTRGYIIKAKLEGVPSKLYEGLTLGDLANNTNGLKLFLKKEEVLNKMKAIGDRGNNSQNNSNNENYTKFKR